MKHIDEREPLRPMRFSRQGLCHSYLDGPMDRFDQSALHRWEDEGGCTGRGWLAEPMRLAAGQRERKLHEPKGPRKPVTPHVADACQAIIDETPAPHTAAPVFG